MAERIERLVSKASKWAALRHKANKDKKIAIIFHNYPPSNSGIVMLIATSTALIP